ncbi:hypothetical protein PI124_g17497 [Phytophthora idaei]|nr:hypothetical protein PI124_g17497 [Phytophthora idaei]
MEPGATPKNTIIDKNQMEGAHFDIANVWWDDVSNAGLTAQSSRNGSVNQSPGSDSVTKNTGSGSTTQTATNSTGTVPDGSWPAIIKTGEVFDGKMQTFERSAVSCEGQTESI